MFRSEAPSDTRFDAGTAKGLDLAAAVSAAGTTKILVVDSACTLTQNETLSMPIIFLTGGSITLASTYNLTIPAAAVGVVDAPPGVQLFYQTGSGTLFIKACNPPYTLEK